MTQIKLVRNTFLKIVIIHLVYIGLPENAIAQEDLRDATGTWLVIAGNLELREHWKVPTVGIVRYYNLAEQTEFGFFRTGITYAPNKKNNLTLGVAFLDTQPFDHFEFESLTTQFWLYEEYCRNQKLLGVKLAHRGRLEKRWITKPHTEIFNVRFRYRLQATYPVSKNLYIKVFDEPFFDFNQSKINQNRFYAGIGRKISPSIQMELGYMKNHVGKNNFDRIRMVFLFKAKLYKDKNSDMTSVD